MTKRKITQLVLTILLVLVSSLVFTGTTFAAPSALSARNGTLTITFGNNPPVAYEIYQCQMLIPNRNGLAAAAPFVFTQDTGAIAPMTGSYYKIETASGRIDDTPATVVRSVQTNAVLPAGASEWMLKGIQGLAGFSAMGVDFTDSSSGLFAYDGINQRIYKGGLEFDNLTQADMTVRFEFEQELAGEDNFNGTYYRLDIDGNITGRGTELKVQDSTTPAPGGSVIRELVLTKMQSYTTVVVNFCGGQAAAAPVVTPDPANNGVCIYTSADVIGKTMYANLTVNKRGGPGTNYASLGSITQGTAVYVTKFENCWISDGYGWYYANLFSFTYGGNTGNGGTNNTAAPACRFANGTDANGVWTPNAGTTYSAPVMIVVPKNSDGSNRFSARSVVYGSWTTPSGGGHTWQYEPANCNIDAELGFMPTTP